jgi:hypothetical protein
LLSGLKKIKERWFLEVVQPSRISTVASEDLNGRIAKLFAFSPGADQQAVWNFYNSMESGEKCSDIENLIVSYGSH